MPDTITMSPILELEEGKLRAVANRVLQLFRLAADRAVAHHAQPRHIHVPSDPNSLEQLFLSRFRELPQAKMQAAMPKVMDRLHFKKRYYGDFHSFDLSSDASVESMSERLAFPEALKFDSAYLNSLNLHEQILPIGPPEGLGFVVQQAPNKLEFRIHKVKCIDETNPEPGGPDEIYLAGTTVNATGDTKEVKQFKVGNFDDGDVVNYSPPKMFTSFNLLKGDKWPKSYFVTLVLAEVDNGGLSDFVHKLFEKVKEHVGAAVGAALGGIVGGVPGAVIGAAIGWVVGKIFDWLKAWWEDDIFLPATLSLSVPSLNARWGGGKTDSPEGWVIWKGHDGTYQLWFDWRLCSS